jgi:hypothetical protein
MGLLARLSPRRRSIISLERLNHCNPRMHDEIASFGGAGQAGSRDLNLRMIMLGFRDGLAQIAFRSVTSRRPPGTGMASQCAGTKTRRNSATNTAAILDEAYLDPTENIQGISIATEIAT